jgi:hypothetical protein
MPELEHELRELGLALAFPETPDVAARVRLQLERAPARRRRRLGRGRALVLAFAILLLGAGTVLAASPDARSTVSRWFSESIPGVVVQRVPSLPKVDQNAPLQLPTRRPDLDAAARAAGLRPLVPKELGQPDAIYADPTGGAGSIVVLLYRPQGRELPRSQQTGVGALVTELHGSLASGPMLGKMAATGTDIERLKIDGRPAMWIAGAPHMVIYNGQHGGTQFEQRRLAGNVLLVEEPGGVLVRIEAQVGKDRAVELARSLEPR